MHKRLNVNARAAWDKAERRVMALLHLNFQPQALHSLVQWPLPSVVAATISFNLGGMPLESCDV